MRNALALVVVGALVVSSAEAGQGGLVRCGSIHATRSNNVGGVEVLTGSVTFRNFDLQHPAIIERLTYRNAFGEVVHDSGPAIGVPHPLNPDFVPAQDITVIPPGASYYLATNHIWGNTPIPGPGGNQQGFSMSVVVEFSKAGKSELLVVGSSLRNRRQVIVFGPSGPVALGGEELSRLAISCDEDKDR